MKEMNWTREEALKRLAFIYSDTKGAMEQDACRAATEPVKKLREKLFDDAVENSHIMTGILIAASAIGIDPDEVNELEVDWDERKAFMKEFTDHAKTLVQEDDMPEGLPDFLAELLK